MPVRIGAVFPQTEIGPDPGAALRPAPDPPGEDGAHRRVAGSIQTRQGRRCFRGHRLSEGAVPAESYGGRLAPRDPCRDK